MSAICDYNHLSINQDFHQQASSHVLSPLPIRTPLSHVMDIDSTEMSCADNNFLNNEESSSYKRKLKCNQFLLDQFEDAAISEINSFGATCEEDDMNYNKKHFIEKNQIHDIPLRNYMSIPTLRLPARVSNPIINDENFSKGEQFLQKQARKIMMKWVYNNPASPSSSFEKEA